MTKVKNKTKQNLERNPLEQLINGGLDQILGASDSKEKQIKHQEKLMIEGQEISLAEFKEKNSPAGEEGKRKIEAGINYSAEIIHTGEKAINQEKGEIEAHLREIMAEIKKLTDSSKELQMQFKEIAVEQHGSIQGKYHKSFFSWLLSIVKAARIRVEDSGAWLEAMHSKKKSREYGAMSKKHGTSFSLSNERNVSTQVG